jgi:site-specific DNA-cytosine methylase
MAQLKALDLFCCSGGAGMGLAAAGFDAAVSRCHRPSRLVAPPRLATIT